MKSIVLITMFCVSVSIPVQAQHRAFVVTDSVLAAVETCRSKAVSEAVDRRIGHQPAADSASKAYDACEKATLAYAATNIRWIRDTQLAPAAVVALKEFYAYLPVALSGFAVSSDDIVGDVTTRYFRRLQPFVDEFRLRANRVLIEFGEAPR